MVDEIINLDNIEYSGSFLNMKLPRALTETEEKDLFIEYYNGNTKAREMLIIYNIKLAKHFTFVYYEKTKYDLNDPLSVSLIGLVKAVDSFKISKGFKFSTYASECIINEILMYIRKNKKYEVEQSFENEYFYDEYYDPTRERIDSCESPYDEIFKEDLYLKVREIINILPEREKEIIKLTYGFDNNIPLKQKEIAQLFNFDQSYISKLTKKTLKLIKRELTESDKLK